MSCASSSPIVSASRLFTLPRELRDLVYDFVFKSDSPTINISDEAYTNPQHYASSSLQLHANQLQFVCKQLCIETSNIASGWKDLTFNNSTPYTPATDVFWHFLAGCSASQRAQIRRVVLLESRDEAPSRTGTPYRQWFRLIYGASHPWLYDFCHQHTSSHLVIRYGFLDASKLADSIFVEEWFVKHACLRMTLRGDFGISFSRAEIHDDDENVDQTSLERVMMGAVLNQPLSERHTLSMEGRLKDALVNLRMTVSTTFEEKRFTDGGLKTYLNCFDAKIDYNERIEELKRLFEEGC